MGQLILISLVLVMTICIYASLFVTHGSTINQHTYSRTPPL